MKRKRKNSNSKVCNSIDSDENIFKNFQESLEKFSNLLNTSINKETYKSPQKKKRRSMRKSLQDSVIIINDSENESNDQNKVDSSICIIECNPNVSKTPTQSQSPSFRRQRTQLKDTLKQRPRSSVISLENDSFTASSCIQNSLEERDINGQNKALSRAEDDIVELWSCIGKPDTSKEVSKECKNSQTGQNAFIIDTTPDLKNLDYIKIDTSPVRKKSKNWYCYNKDPTIKKFNLTRKLMNKKEQSKTYNQSNKSISKNQDKKSEKENSNRKYKLREIIIDGCNVAMAHMNGQRFSEKGIKLMIDYFESRGHTVKVFLPQHIRRKEYQLLEKMYKKGIVVFTPSRNIAGKQITPYDDRYILEYATKCGGIVISSDQYRDLYRENPEWRDTILNRLLTPTFVGDYIMFPVDPLGKSGPDLETFLRH